MQEPQDSESNAPNEGASQLFGGDGSTGTGGRMNSSSEVSESDERLWSILSHVSVLVAPYKHSSTKWLGSSSSSPTRFCPLFYP
jgi:hypothetical protein